MSDPSALAQQVLSAASLFARPMMSLANQELVAAIYLAGGRFDVRVVDVIGTQRVELVGIAQGKEFLLGHVDLQRVDRGPAN